MDSASDINICKKLLDELEESERINDSEILIRLENTYHHLPPQTAPRLQRSLDECIARSEEILSALFDKVEISDKSLLHSLLRTFLAYGNFRLTQIIYHIESARDEIEPDVRITPIIVKEKWYDLTPLLPKASSLGWKSILIHGLVKDTTEIRLQKICHQLLLQKLHFYASIAQLDRFKGQIQAIQRNGERIAETIAEKVFDAANDDQELVEMDAFIFNLLIPFTSIEQQTALIEAIVVARFKSQLAVELLDEQEHQNNRLDKLISHCIMDDATLQDILFVKLIEHMKCNLIRRKRRHSVEEDESEGLVTLESVLGDILAGVDPCQTISGLPNVHVTSKSLQKSYLKKWILFVEDILTRKTLTPKSATILLTTCSVILITCSKNIDQDLTAEVSLLLAKIIDTTNYKKLDKLFKVCGTNFVVEQTKLFATSTELLDDFETPVMRYYRSILNRHMRLCTIRHFQKDVEKFSAFVAIICDRTVGKSKSTILGYIYLCELSELLESVTGNKNGNKTLELYVEYGRSIAKKLYSFIKNRPFTKTTDVDETMSTDLTNGCNGGYTDETPASDQVQIIVMDALVCIISIAVDRKEQTILDTYGELMLKLFNLVCKRVVEIGNELRTGASCKQKPVDAQLSRLCNLYVSHREIIEPYLCYDLNKEICEKLLIQEHIDSDLVDTEAAHSKRKSVYTEIKSRLEELHERDDLIYQTIINRQYTTVVDQSLGQASDFSPEESCCKKSLKHLTTLSDVISTVSSACDLKTYERVVSNIVTQFEYCDALDHPQVLNLFHSLVALIPKNIDKSAEKSNVFKKSFPTIGCSLIRIAKSVELGPSVLSFTNSGSHKSSGGIQCCIYSNCIRIYALLFNRFPPAFTNSLTTDAMQICISSNPIRYAKYNTRLHKFFIQLATSISSLLKAIGIGKRDTYEQLMPVFLSVFSLLIRCLILGSDRQKLEELPRLQMNGHSGDGDNMDVELTESTGNEAIDKQCKVYESQLEYLSRDVGRLLNNLCSLETKLVEYAPHLISSYIKDTQLAACPDFVKKHIDEGVFRIFNLVDSYQKDRLEKLTDKGVQRKTIAGRASGSIFEMVHARLDQASREIFKDMHDNYNRFHRYLGKC